MDMYMMLMMTCMVWYVAFGYNFGISATNINRFVCFVVVFLLWRYTYTFIPLLPPPPSSTPPPPPKEEKEAEEEQQQQLLLRYRPTPPFCCNNGFMDCH